LRDLTREERRRVKKSYSRCHARFCEKADPPKALSSVASYLGNRKFYGSYTLLVKDEFIREMLSFSYARKEAFLCGQTADST
jgi:hypothetical protein